MEMKHQDGVAPSAEDTAKLNEMATWLDEHGYHGVVLLRKGDIGVSWVNEDQGADGIRKTIVNSIAHLFDESEEAAKELIKGMIMVIGLIKMAHEEDTGNQPS